MKKLILLNLLITGLSVMASAQWSGYAGKRFLVRSDVVEGRYAAFSGVGLEYIVNKKFSFYFGIKNFNSQVVQRYRSAEFNGIYDHPLSGKMNEKAQLQTRSFELEGRVYLLGDWRLPAPDGFFAYFNLRYGQFDVNKGSYYLELIEPSGNDYVGPYNDQVIEYAYENINFTTTEIGMGVQKLINEWVTVGGKAGMNLTLLSLDNEGFNEKIISGVAKQYGSNLFAIPISGFSKQPDSGNFGFSFMLQVGILIY